MQAEYRGIYRKRAISKIALHMLCLTDGDITCFHTLEHVRRLDTALSELRRVRKKQLFLIVPRQRFFRFTLDLRIHFFYSPLYF